MSSLGIIAVVIVQIIFGVALYTLLRSMQDKSSADDSLVESFTIEKFTDTELITELKKRDIVRELNVQRSVDPGLDRLGMPDDEYKRQLHLEVGKLFGEAILQDFCWQVQRHSDVISWKTLVIDPSKLN